MKLITEEVQKVKFIVEGKGGNKKMYIEGVFLQGDIKNRNGRLYPVSTLAKEVNRYNESFVRKGRAAIIVPEPFVKSAVKAKRAGFNPEVFKTLAAPDFLLPFRNKFCLYLDPIINENGIAPII